MRFFLNEAMQATDEDDFEQGLVRLTVRQIGLVYGWVEQAAPDAVTMRYVKRMRVTSGSGREPVEGDFTLNISLADIITARYADSSEIRTSEEFRL